MRLKTIKLKNFRSYKQEFSIDFHNLTTLIGENDIGKSTILEALEIFFNNDLIKIEAADRSLGSSESEVIISCIFDDLPNSLTIDARAQTSLSEEHLLNVNGDLEIVKVYDCSLKSPSCAIYVNANYPISSGELHSLKNDELKSKIKALGIDQSSIDLRSNVEIRKAIWSTVSPLTLVPTLLTLEKEDGKKVWAKLKDELPIYALFQSDRPSKDEDNEVQDPMKLAIQEAISTVQDELNEVKKKVQQKAQEVASRTLEKLREMDPNLAKDLNPRFKSEPKWDSVFKLSLTDDNQIPINKRGSGTRRLILINFFRAEAERKQQEKSARGVIYAIEEPETSQHPNNQKILVEALIDLSNKPNCQVLLTTHVPNLAEILPISSIRFLRTLEGQKVVQDNTNELVLKQVTNQLGILPDRRVKLLVCVEGPCDVTALIHLSKILHAVDSTLPSLENEERIAFMPLGGSTLRQWVDNYYSKNLNLPEVHVYDRDVSNPPQYQHIVNTVNARSDGSWATLTRKRELENYIHKSVLTDRLGVSIEYGDNDDVPNLVVQAVNIDPNHSLSVLGETRAKKIIAEAFSSMTAEHLVEIDPDKEIEGWLREIQKRIE